MGDLGKATMPLLVAAHAEADTTLAAATSSSSESSFGDAVKWCLGDWMSKLRLFGGEGGGGGGLAILAPHI